MKSSHVEQINQIAIFCSGCGNSHHRTGQNYCHSCHAAYMRTWRPMREAAKIEEAIAKYQQQQVTI